MPQVTLTFDDPSKVVDGTAGSGDNSLQYRDYVFTINAQGSWTANFSGGRFNFQEDASVGGENFTISVTNASGASFGFYNYQISVDGSPEISGGWVASVNVGNTNWPDNNLHGDGVGPYYYRSMFLNPGDIPALVYSSSLNIFDSDFPGSTTSGSMTLWLDNITIDYVAPAPKVTNVSSSSANGTYKVGDTISVTVTFDQDVTVTGSPQLTLETGATDRVVNYASGSGTNTLTFAYTVQAGDMSADLDYVSSSALSLNGGTFKNADGSDAVLTLPGAGSGTSLSGNKDIVVDGVAPMASIVVADADLKAGETSLVTITFSEAVTGFDNTDLTVTNGSLSAVSSSDGGITWTATFTPTAGITDTTNVITLDNSGVTDAAGNAGSGTTDSNNFGIDTVRPTASVVVADTTLAAGETSLVTITFSETVTGFDNTDLTVTNGSLSPVSSTDGGITWTATFTPTTEVADTTNVITLDNSGVTNAAGNAGSGTTDSNNFVIDTARPTASIVVADTTLAAGETSLVTITFSEAVTGFDNTDLTVTNGSLSPVSSTDGGITWTATFTPAARVADTTNVITLDNSGVADAVGNAGSGTTDSNNFVIDTARPTASIIVADANLKAGETSLVTITFSEAVTGFDNTDLTVTNGTLSPVNSSDGGITWTATFTPTAGITDTTNVITLDNSGVADAAGNAGSGTTDSNNFIIDTIPVVVEPEPEPEPGVSIPGGNGSDVITGGSGDDTLGGGGGNDRIDGGAGNDQIYGGTGDDTVFGGDGNDRIFGGAGNGADQLYGGGGDDEIWSGGGNDRAFGGDGDDVIGGGDGDDEIGGGDGNDTLYGGTGNDSIFGGGGADVVNGGAGDDIIWGGGGSDTLSGGAGKDTFFFAPGQGQDVILDFTRGDDRMDLRNFGNIDFTDLSITVAGGDSVIAIGGISITVSNVTTLSASDFIFA